MGLPDDDLPERRASLGQLMQSNRTCLLVGLAVSGLLFFACLVMGLLALYR